MGEQTMVLRQNDEIIDQLERVMVDNLPVVDCPLVHLFTPKLYVRQIFMEAGLLVTSKIHKTIHPFTISKGKVAVSIDGGEWEVLEAPFTGVTQAGTRRILYILEDCIWSTYHPLDFIKGDENFRSEEEQLKVVEIVENTILEAYKNNLLN